MTDQPSGVGALVLSQRADASLYRDDESGYEFPARYLKLFGTLSVPGARLVVLIHEPERLENERRGGWVCLMGDSRRAAGVCAGATRIAALWREAYLGGIMPLPCLFGLVKGGHLFESWRWAIPADQRNRVMLGRSMRVVPMAEVLDVLRAVDAVSGALVDWEPAAGAHPEEGAVRERVTVERLVRARGFRTQVLATGLLDAAHLTSVERSGRNDVRNGVSLALTIHRLYDAGQWVSG